MRWLVPCTMLCALGWLADVRAEEEPRAVVDRATKAVGGEAKLLQGKAVQLKVKGTIHAPEGAHPFTAVIHSQLPGRYKHDMVYDKGNLKVTQIQVYNHDELSIRVDNQVLSLDVQLRDALLKGRYAESLAGLTMLKDRDVTLTSVGEVPVEKKPALGIKVTVKERPDVQMLFDKETGLLVKTEHKQMDPRTRQEVVQEMFYDDYRELDTTAADEQTLKNAKLAVEGPALLDYFRKLAKTGTDRDKMLSLIKHLGDESFEVREKASADLIGLGAVAVPYLKEALKDGDLEVVRRAERCLKEIAKDPAKGEADQSVPAAAARLLATRKPAGAAEVLLNYLPSAADEVVAREVRAALSAVAVTDGQPDKALLAALEDKDLQKREAAAEALGRSAVTQPGRKILITGLKRPMKGSVYRAGRKFMEWEVLDVTYFNKLDDKVFTLPLGIPK